MRSLRLLAIFFGAVFLGGALVAPWLYWLAQAAAPLHRSLQALAGNPFHRFVDRSFMLVAVAGLWPLLRSLNIRSWRELGLVSPTGQRGKFGAGLALGFGSLALAAAITVVAGVRTLNLNHPPGKVLSHVLNAGLAALGASVLEEIVFRGALFGALRKHHGWILALIMSSAIYSLVHFFGRPVEPEKITWASGFVTLGQQLRGFVDVERLLPGFFTLALAGSLLALAYQRTGNLYFSTGLHAGWIFWLKSFAFLTSVGAGNHLRFWGAGPLRDSWLALLVLALCVPILWRLPSLKKQESFT